MYPVLRNRRNWAIGGMLLLAVVGTTPAAFGQKFARARSAADNDAEPVETTPAATTVRTRSATRSRLVSPRGSYAPRSPIAGSSQSPQPVFTSPFAAPSASRAAPRRFVPGWQTSDGVPASSGGRVIRHVPGTPINPQEGDIIYEEPDFTAITSPGRVRTSRSVSVRQGGRTFEQIGPGQPTPAPGARSLVQPEGSEGPVIEESIVDGGSMVEGEDGEMIYEDGGFGPDGDCCGGCSPCNYSQWGPKYYDDGGAHHVVPCDGVCIPRSWVDETALFLGIQGFTTPMDHGLPPGFGTSNGNFGYHEGVNFAGHFGKLFGLGSLGLGYQVGATFLQSDLNGDVVNPASGYQMKNRDQQFFTAGLFRRAHDGYGLQGGFVYDYMHDNFWTKYSVGQIRVELSYLTFYGHEFGFWGAFSIHDGHDIVNGTPFGFQTIDMYNGFYRYTFDNGAQGRIWFGGTDSKQGITGADFRLPLANRWDLWGWYNYIIPGNRGFVGLNNQGFNLTLNLVWYPGRKCDGIHNTPFRALFAPADNNWLITRPSSM